MKVFQNTGTLAVLFMNYLQSREQKWKLVGTHPRVLLVNHLQSREQKVVSGKHSISTHFPKDRNCGFCLRTKITRASCRRRTGTVVPRLENFGDLTADHKVLSEGCESRNNHVYAVVVQDLATQWIQSYPCKTKTSLETHKSSQKFLDKATQIHLHLQFNGIWQIL